MKRRAFLERMALVPAAVTGLGGWMARAGGHPESWTFASSPKIRVEFPYVAGEQEMIQFLRQRVDAVYLHGGPVYAGLMHGKHPWTNLVLEGGELGALKSELFSKGVQPVSTVELQPTFFKFFWQDRLFHVTQTRIEEICQSNYVVHQGGGLPFAHNYLALETDGGLLHDPYGAVTGAEGLAGGMRLVSQPRTVVEGFDVVLASLFDATLLKLERHPSLKEFEQRMLASSCPASQAKYITERILNYYPDMLERLGSNAAASIACSILVKDAMEASLGVDFERTHRSLVQRAESGVPSRSIGREFMTVLNRQMGEDSGGPSLFASRAARFLMRNQFGVRCPEWMAGRELS